MKSKVTEDEDGWALVVNKMRYRAAYKIAAIEEEIFYPLPQAVVDFHNGQIEDLSGKVIWLRKGTGSSYGVDDAFMEKYRPEVGGYYVVYADLATGYESAAVFEAHNKEGSPC